MSNKLFSKVEHILRLGSPDKRQVETLKEIYEEIQSKLNEINDTLSTAFTTEQANEVKKTSTKEKKHYEDVKHQMDEYFKKHSITI